ncbi:MAG: thiamine diphosphokinase [Chloroflexota bacterium]
MPAKGVGVKAIVVAGGDAAAEDAALLGAADLVIAADSGAAWLEAVDRRPDLVVGDMDSIPPDLLSCLAAEGVAIESHPPDKDASDAELAVSRAVVAGADEVTILGAFGGLRLDHELANVMLLLTDGWRDAELRLVRGGMTVRAVQGGRRLELEGGVGDVVTLLPLGCDATGVRTGGLRFHLDGETLHLGRSRGLSNVIEGAPASVSLDGGILLVIETRREPGS